MAYNTTGAVPVSLDVLGGWCTEMAAVALPEGVSPDCQDVGFLPGSVYSRPALQRVFASAFPAGGPNSYAPSVVYGKSFVTPNGDIKNLYLDSNGVMWVEDWTNSPGTYTQLFTTTPGSYCKSITAFGREFIAISDGLHGTDIPFQYDGTNLDRITMDGPGLPPVVSSIALPSVALATSGGVTGGVSTATTTNLTYYQGGRYYAAVQITLTAPAALSVGSSITISGNGNAFFNTTWYVDQIWIGSPGAVTSFKAFGYFPTLESGSGGSYTATSGITLSRSNNTVSGETASAHNLQVGYQVQISGVSASVVGTSISSIAIKNEDNPGIALVTTSSPHGLLPGNEVTITGVAAVAVGGATSAFSNGTITTLTTTTAHGLVPGASIIVSGFTTVDTIFNGTFTVAQIPGATQIAYYQSLYSTSTAGGTATPISLASGSTGAVSIAWPVPDNTPTPTYFEVLSAPTATTFQVQVTYSDGTWTSGTVSFGWDGIFFVTAVPSTTTFEYQQYGPPISTTSSGTMTPYGQATPGLHLCQVLWQTRQGWISAPSPPTTFIASGGQYLSITNIPIGPSNVIARTLAFSGAQPNVPGVLPPMFYIPVPAQADGLTVSTATVIADNTTTSALLDFADNTLFAATGISILGNNLVNQIVIDGALGFSYVSSRLMTWGQRATIQNFINLGFDGGYISGALYNPLGWSSGLSAGTLINSPRPGSGMAFQFTLPGTLRQSAYQDAYGAPIVEPNVTYKVRFWAETNSPGPSNTVLVFQLESVSTSFGADVVFSLSQLPAGGGWVEGTLNLPTPLTIPNDMQLLVYVNNLATGTITVDEISIFDAENPYSDTQAFGSYVNNAEGLDGVTGNMQPTEDTRKLMDFGLIRGTPYALTQDPSGRIHEVIINPTSEPSGWSWNEVSSNCGTLSAFSLTHSQADDYSASGGDSWMAWASEGGVMMFDGGLPEKISQEIQQAWSGLQLPGVSWMQINMNAATTIQALNDPVERIMYFFLPLGSSTGPSEIYALYYKELNSARAIMGSPPFHPSLSGKLVATDNTRKWAPWARSITGAARMYRSTTGRLEAVFFAGSGKAPGAIASPASNVYTLNSEKYVDDDYGTITPYYTTCFFLDPIRAQGVGLISVRLLLAYMNVFISGIGNVTYTFLVNSLTNAWPLTVTRTLSTSPNFDQELAGGSAMGNRIAVRVSAAPILPSSNVQFNLQRFQTWWKKAKLTLRGAAQ